MHWAFFFDWGFWLLLNDFLEDLKRFKSLIILFNRGIIRRPLCLVSKAKLMLQLLYLRKQTLNVNLWLLSRNFFNLRNVGIFQFLLIKLDFRFRIQDWNFYSFSRQSLRVNHLNWSFYWGWRTYLFYFFFLVANQIFDNIIVTCLATIAYNLILKRIVSLLRF